MQLRFGLLVVWLFCPATTAFAEGNTEYFLDQFAPSAQERAGWQEDRRIYETFVATPEFVDRSLTEKDTQVRAELDEACLYNFKDCQAYISQNRMSILTSLPDNPLYWRHFWATLKISPYTYLDPNSSPDYQRLIPATQWWFFRDLARDGEVDIDDALALQAGLNQWLQSHHTLLGRIMTIAMRGVAFRQINHAMAQASRDRDEQSLRALVQSILPNSFQESAYGKTLWMEREFATLALEKLVSSSEWQSAEMSSLIFDLKPDLDPEDLRQVLADPITLHKSDADIFAGHYIAESIKPWGRYWSEGIRPINYEDSDLSLMAKTSQFAHGSYIATERYSSFFYVVFAALADIYTGSASPGMPGRPAPPNWRWDWREGPYPQVCLVSETIHPSTKQGMANGTAEMCLEYFDEKAVSALIH